MVVILFYNLNPLLSSTLTSSYPSPSPFHVLNPHLFLPLTLTSSYPNPHLSPTLTSSCPQPSPHPTPNPHLILPQPSPHPTPNPHLILPPTLTSSYTQPSPHPTPNPHLVQPPTLTSSYPQPSPLHVPNPHLIQSLHHIVLIPPDPNTPSILYTLLSHTNIHVNTDNVVTTFQHLCNQSWS